MGIFFSVTKCLVFTFNFLTLILGIGCIVASTLGLENAPAGTEEHTYFIIGIIIGSLVCMTTFFGCYGVLCESLGVNTIYALFILIMLAIQVIQMQTQQHQTFYRNAVQRLENAWLAIETEPKLMQELESDYHCCALYNSRDYNYKKLATPASCYQHGNAARAANLYARGCMEALQQIYEFELHRENICNWCLALAEAFVFLCSSCLSILLYKQYTQRHSHLRPVRGYVEPRMNHVHSRTHLLSA